MFHLLGSLPSEFTLALSGGPDSMAAASFFLLGRKKFKVCYFNHSTPHGEEAHRFVREYASKKGLNLITGFLSGEKPKNMSQEEYWSVERNNFFFSIPGYVITAHHLGDCLENWVLSCIHGKYRMINYRKRNVIRPFLLTPKEDMVGWCNRKGVSYLQDPSNGENKYNRNRVRNLIIPEILKVNPGFEKVVRKQVQDFLDQTRSQD